MKNLILLITLWIGTFSIGNGQAFVQLSNASGYDYTQIELDSLEVEAQRLIEVLPTEFQSDFKVFDFGYYVYNEMMNGGSPAIWDKAIAEADSRSQNYILFGREHSKNGGFNELKVKLKWEGSSVYTCINEENRTLIENLIKSFSQSNHKITKEHLTYSTKKINHFYNCCDNGNRNLCENSIAINEIRTLLQGQFFELENIKVSNDLYDYSVNEGIVYSGNFKTEYTNFLNSLGSNNLSGEIREAHFHEGQDGQGSTYIEILDFVNSRNSQNLDYKEDIIYFKESNGRNHIFIRLYEDINWHFDNFKQGHIDNNRSSAIIPALIAKWVMKRMFKAAGGVIFGFGIEVALERYFVNWNNPDCDWWTAGTDVLLITPPHQWFVWALEGLLDKSSLAALLGGCTESINYLYTSPDFQMTEFLQKFVTGGIKGYLINKGIGFVFKGVKKLLPEKAERELEQEVDQLVLTWLLDPKTIRSYMKIIKHPIRTSKGFLKEIKDFSDDVMAKLDDDLSNPKWKDELTELFKQKTSDVKEIWKVIKDDPSLAWELSKENPIWEKWLKRSFFKHFTKAGREYEAKLLNNLRTRSGEAYQKLKNKVPDIDERKLISQIQFCIPGISPPCNAKGEYFIADQVWVKFDIDNNIEDMIIIDAKLSGNTGFTTGQGMAKNYIGGEIAYKAQKLINQDIDGVTLLSEITQGTLIKIKHFFKGFEENTLTIFN